MDTFCEQVVKRDNKLKHRVISAILVAVFAMLEILFIMVYFVARDPFWIMFNLIVGIIAVFVLTVMLPRINRVEYDYSVVGNNLYIDKVLDRKKRKSFLKLEISTITDMGVIEGDNIPCVKFAKTRDASTGKLEGSYYCIHNEGGRGKCLLIFSPAQKIVDGMRPHLNRELIMKLFHNKK